MNKTSAFVDRGSFRKLKMYKSFNLFNFFKYNSDISYLLNTEILKMQAVADYKTECHHERMYDLTPVLSQPGSNPVDQRECLAQY